VSVSENESESVNGFLWVRRDMDEDFKRPLRHLRRARSQIRSDVEQELRFHLEMRIAQLVEAGMSPGAAREEALRQFGDIDSTREVCVSSDERLELVRRRRRYVDEVRHDVVHGLRQLRRRWQVNVLAALMLGAGVGASTAIFSATDHVLLRPLPYAQADRAVTLWETDEREGARKIEVSPGNFLDWQRRARMFEVMGLAEPFSFDVMIDGRPLAVPSWNVSQGYLEALGVRPILGRLFSAQEYAQVSPQHRGAAPVVLISEGMWKSRFAGDRNVLGKVIQLDIGPASIVGVLSSGVKYPEATDIWAPKAFQPYELTDRQSQYMRAVGRLKPGVTVAQAQTDLHRIARELEAENPATNKQAGINVVPLEDQIFGGVRTGLLVLLLAVGFVLLIACANVASLLLAAGSERGRELAVRAALGAGRNRLVHQLVTESVLLALIGGAVGLFVAWAGIRALILLSPDTLPRVESMALDGRVLGFSLAVTLLTAVLFGLAPAWRFSRPDLLSTLRASGRSLTAGRERNRLRRMLVIGEIALALVLLIGAGLLMRSFVTLLGNDLGFATTNRVTLQAFLWDLNPTPEQIAQKVATLEQAFATTPGVLDVGAVSSLPFHPHAIDAQTKLTINDRPLPAHELPSVHTTIVTPTYFRTLEIPLRRGRALDERDRPDAPRVALINDALARRYFPDENPVGKHITVGAMSRSASREIVGVVGDVRPLAFDSEARPEIYVPFAQSVTGSVTFVIRTGRAADRMLPVLRERLWQVDERQSIYWSATLDELVGVTLVERRFHLVLLASFSAIALILATIGIYGLISFATQQRINEIGVRLALGAERKQIVGMIVSQGLRLALPGVALGILGALVLTRFLQTLLYGVRPTDPATFTQIAVLMIVVAGAASLIPARRAVRGSPIRSILNE
jgi:putative ABC transport system permease protein